MCQRNEVSLETLNAVGHNFSPYAGHLNVQQGVIPPAGLVNGAQNLVGNGGFGGNNNFGGGNNNFGGGNPGNFGGNPYGGNPYGGGSGNQGGGGYCVPQ